MLRRQLLFSQFQIPRLPQDGRQQPLLGAGNAQCLTAACAVRHLDLIHLAGMQPLVVFLPAVLAACPLCCGAQLRQNGGFGDVGLLCQPPGVHLLLGGVRALGQHFHGFLYILQPLRVLREIILVPQALEPEIQRIAHPVQKCLKTLRAVFFDVFVRVLCAGNLQNAHLYRAVAEQFQRAQGRFLTGLVRVVAQNDFVGILADDAHLPGGQRGAAGADGSVDARLLHTDDVHVALAQHEPPGGAALCDLHGKHRLGFVVDQRLRAVDVFGLGVVHHAPAKGNDVAAQVKDGGHDTLPEQAVDAPGLAALEQAAGIQLLLVVAFIPQVLVQRLPIVGGIAQPEPDDGLIVQPAPPPVSARLPRLLHGRVQAGMEEAGGLLVHGKHPAAQASGLIVLLRFRHPGAGSQHLDGFAAADIVDLFDKADGISGCLTTETVKALGVRVHIKGRRFFAVKRAQPAVQPSLAFELHIAAHQLHNVGAAGKLLDVFVWDHVVLNDLSSFKGRAISGARTVLQRCGWQTRRSYR